MTRFIVGVDDAHADAVDEIAERLRSQGFEVGRVLTDLGLIEVSARHADVSAIAAVEGVDEVAESVAYQLPPPDSPIQ